MLFEGDTLTVYYPRTNSGLKIPSIQGEVTLPIFQLAINAATEDAGMTAAGYELTTSIVSGDSVMAVWAPPRETRSVLGELTATYIRDSLVAITAVNADGKVVLRQTYSNWIANKGRLFPCRVHSVNSAGEVEMTESIIFNNVALTTELSSEANAMVLPDDADIITLEL